MNVMPMVDYAAKTIILTEAFSRAARVPFSDAFNQLARLREALPGLEVVVREHRRLRVTPRTQNIPKFVSYEKMEAYIRLLPDGDALMERYRLVRAFAKPPSTSATKILIRSSSTTEIPTCRCRFAVGCAMTSTRFIFMIQPMSTLRSIFQQNIIIAGCSARKSRKLSP